MFPLLCLAKAKHHLQRDTQHQLLALKDRAPENVVIFKFAKSIQRVTAFRGSSGEGNDPHLLLDLLNLATSYAAAASWSSFPGGPDD